jgi:DNA-binding IclR family transcriptional regulator
MSDNDRNSTASPDPVSQAHRLLRPSGFIQSVDRALSILEIFTREQPECGVSDIARTLSLNKSTAFGLLSTLERRGYVEQNPENGKYRLGLKALEVGSLKIASFDVAGIAHPILKSLVAQLGETVHLAIYDRGEVIYIDKVESDNTLRIASFIGKRNPAYCTGVGKCLLAFQPKSEIDRVLGQGLVPRTSKTIVNPREFLDELSKIRETDHARDDEEFTLGLVCASAPVRDSSGQVIAAISVSAPTIRTPPERQEEFSRILEEAARTISQTLGYRPR